MSSNIAGQKLQGYRTAQFCVLGQIDFTHTACTDFGNYAIVRNRSTGGKFCHW